MLNKILTKLLRQEHRDIGLTLEEDEDFVYLVRAGHTVATFSATGATIESIIREADQHLEWSRSGITFEKVNSEEPADRELMSSKEAAVAFAECQTAGLIAYAGEEEDLMCELTPAGRDYALGLWFKLLLKERLAIMLLISLAQDIRKAGG